MPPVGMSMKKNPSEDRIRLEKSQDLLQTTHHSSGHRHHLSRGVHLSLHSQDHEGNDRIFHNPWREQSQDTSFHQQEREGW